MIGLINRGALPPVVEDEFEHLIARLKSLWLAEHNEDGSHTTDFITINSTMPVGVIMLWPTNTLPTGWLLCNGQAISRSIYDVLFTVIGTTYGAGDGSTTFNVPGRNNVAFQSAPVYNYIIFAGA